MAKKLISVWLSMTVLLLSILPLYAFAMETEAEPEEEIIVQGSFFIRNIDINGVQIANYYLKDPLFIYQDVTYLPLTAELGEILGFEAETDPESHTLKILKTEATRTNLTEFVLKSNLNDVDAVVVEDAGITAYYKPEKPVMETPLSASGIMDFVAGNLAALIREAEVISLPALAAAPLDGDAYQALQVGQTIYVPVRMFTESGVFGWSVYFDEYSGIYISTDPKIPAAEYYNEQESRYNLGLTNYILSQNKWISRAEAQGMVFIFKHEADVNDLDLLLLMALARRESTFQAGIQSRSGAVGVMQIMPGTGERFGYTYEQLLTAHYNIEMGAKYISGHLDHYENSVTALSAYNMGGAAISRGGYRTTFAEKVLDTRTSLRDYMVDNGYTEF